MGSCEIIVELLKIKNMFISKQDILNAFKYLTTNCPHLGVTTRTSYFMYFFAFDRFYKKNDHDLNTRDSNDVTEYYSFLFDTVGIDEKHFLNSFKEVFSGSKNLQKTAYSNFTHGRVVDNSVDKKSQNVDFNYPKEEPAILVAKNGIVRYYDDWSSNISYYVDEKAKKALSIWLLRNIKIEESIETTLEKLYTPDLCSWLSDFVEDDTFDISNIRFTESLDQIGIDDIKVILYPDYSDFINRKVSFYKKIKEENNNQISSYIVNAIESNDFHTILAEYTKYDSLCKIVDKDIIELCIKKTYCSSFKSKQFMLEGLHQYKDFLTVSSPIESIQLPTQKIYYGAPGTGKSNEIKMLTGEGKDGIKYSKNLTFRTTFHPDSDYSTFVGAYKPMWNKSAEKIVYDFRPQTFIKAYVAAWTHPTKRVALVIEEINRGNCAQIFGDIFQLLDRESNGLSKYPIEVDMDMQDFLERAFSDQIKESWAGSISDHDEEEIDAYYSKHYDGAFSKIKKGEILCLPKNLSILATMNTSDQSLFPMDSAFKRRWEWIYQPITKGINSKTGKDLAWKIRLAGCKPIDWWLFLTRINKIISDLTTSEDKQLGYFFCLPDDKLESGDEELTIISSDRFVNKVIFYLWNDVFKDYAFDTKCCKDDNDKEILFAKFYNEDGKSVNEQTLLHFFKTLNIENEKPLVEEILPSVNTLIAEDVPHDNEVTEKQKTPQM